LHVPVALLWGEYFQKYLSTINTMNMKKILLIATLFSIFGISQTKAQKVVEYGESQARLAEPTM
jgi:hypothetical protein